MEGMENREDLKSMLPFLPLLLGSSNLFWPSQVVKSLETLSKGPLYSKVDSGELLFNAISHIRDSLALPSLQPVAPFAHGGYALFFDELISRAEASKWFEEVVPALANLLLRLPSLLESHYQDADYLFNGVGTGLRLLGSQEAGIVFLGQELVAALLTCAFFCLFPVSDRGSKRLPTINFDNLFEDIYESYSKKQENKIKCIMHYFERICSSMPEGFVSFERKVLLLEQLPLCVSYPEADFWSKSVVSLCPFEVHSSGFIEDQSNGALEVDFANKYLGGGALRSGCLQEEIRFMISPELIAGMLFLPCMEDNEAIEIVGAERFSNYTGYASSFCFSGDHVDKRNVDGFRRCKTRIVAIDALCRAGMRQYKCTYLLREANKAFCGFLDQSNCDHHKSPFQDGGSQGSQCMETDKDTNVVVKDFPMDEAPSTSVEIAMNRGEYINQVIGYSDKKGSWCLDLEDKIGIATGNWGCGAFGGDPELKTMIQWLAASQAARPSVSYYTFGIKSLQNLNQVSQWILSHEWTVGDLWNMLVEYSSRRFNKETNLGFFAWLLPTLFAHDAKMSNLTSTP
ncbi:poly(ADP-ribose) glycohydrolase 1-like isoform X1 [Populus alba x Populus x berolinensis]|uniref:poly(ADP-ribose) glycohydrolase n=2 Tax=Populus alba x Populus x berolinensis TaxID=444605 RepID=A0AAD6LE55_9ROSI|nr:poly(ADP-ribose) glycohydrolase 1-like isoform X1 [Populus alba x Populus x berolinensis]